VDKLESDLSIAASYSKKRIRWVTYPCDPLARYWCSLANSLCTANV